jgi:hypothetical protein
MSEEILEQQSEELEEKQQAVKSSGAKIKEQEEEKPEEEEDDEEEVKEEHDDEEDEEEKEVEEAVEIPKTKAGMMKAIYDQLNSMKKADLTDSFGAIMGSTLAEQEEEDDDDEEEKEKPVESKKLSKEDLEIDVKEDIDAIVSGEELSEDFKTKAATIFEAAVSAKVISEVNDRLQIFEDEYTKELSEAKEEYMTNMSEKIDGYLNYVVEEWMEENELAVEKGIRSELVEDFMTGLKNLFQEHYIDIPEEKVDLVDDLFEKVEELETKLDESINTNVEVKKELAKFKKEEVLRSVSEELAETEKEKLTKLADGIDYEDDSQYQEKLEVLKENYFPKTSDAPQTISEEVENTETEENTKEHVDPSISRYVKAMKRHN